MNLHICFSINFSLNDMAKRSKVGKQQCANCDQKKYKYTYNYFCKHKNSVIVVLTMLISSLPIVKAEPIINQLITRNVKCFISLKIQTYFLRLLLQL